MQISFDLLPEFIRSIYFNNGEYVRIKSIQEIHKSIVKSEKPGYLIEFNRETHAWTFNSNWHCKVITYEKKNNE
jgi:hypothetical protein